MKKLSCARWIAPYVWETRDSQIPDSARVPMSQWGYPENEGHMPSCRITNTMAGRIQRMKDVAAAVTRYRYRHPEASWDEIFENVPSHYKSKNNMQQMSEKLAKKRKAAR